MNNCLHGPNLKIQSADYFNLEGDVSDPTSTSSW